MASSSALAADPSPVASIAPLPVSSIPFKIDFSGLPKLSANGENFAEWRSSWQLALKATDLWSVVVRRLPKPAAETHPDMPAWETRDTKAMVTLVASVHSDLTLAVTSCDSAADAWDHLVNRFDRDTGNMSILLFRTLTNLRYHDGDDLKSHLEQFHQLWQRMAKRTATSTQSVAKAMDAIFRSDEVKGSFFLATLPETMDNVIDNLSTRNVTTYQAIQPKILDIAETHSLSSVDSVAYAVQSSHHERRSYKPLAGRNQTGVLAKLSSTKPTPPSRPNTARSFPTSSSASADECTWCRKHNLSFVGHVYTNCRQLAKDKAQRNQSQSRLRSPPRERSKRQKANNAMVTYGDSDESEDGVTVASAFAAVGTTIDLTSPPPSPSLSPSTDTVVVNQNGKRTADHVSAHAAIKLPKTSDPPVWLFDTGASRHMSGSIDDFVSLSPEQGTIAIPGELKLPIHGKGTINLRCRLPDGSVKLAELTNALYSSELFNTRLFSWGYVRNRGFELYAKSDDLFLSKDGRHHLWARHTNGIIRIQTGDMTLPSTKHMVITTVSGTTARANFASYREFHESIGHHEITNPFRVFADGHLIPSKPADFHCSTCQMSKSVRHRPKADHSRITKPFEVIHSDLSGRFEHKSLAGARYYISFIDDATRYSWIRFIKVKAEAPQAIKDFIAFVNTQHNATVDRIAGSAIRRIKSDNGGEYMASDLQQHFKKLGIVHDNVPPYHHELNGVAERFNRSITQLARSMIQSDDHMRLWAEAIHTANFVNNLTPKTSDSLHRSSHELLFGEKPHIQRLRPFGTTAYVHISVEARKPGTKLLHRAEQGIFVGYGRTTKTSRLYIPGRHVVMESQNVTFKPWTANSPGLLSSTSNDEDGVHQPHASPPNRTTESARSRQVNRQVKSELTTPGDSDADHGQIDTSQPVSPAGTDQAEVMLPPNRPTKPNRRTDTSSRSSTRPPSSQETSVQSQVTTRSGRTVRPTSRAQGLSAQADESDDGDTPFMAFSAMMDESSPLSHTEAVVMGHEWAEAIDREIEAHHQNGTWTPVDAAQLPRDTKLVDTKWVFATKRDDTGTIVKRKARIVARGFTQRPGIDFDETYSPVARYDSFRLIMTIAYTMGWSLRQIDFDAAYLNSDLKHHIYAKCPPGLRYGSGNTIKILKALYGLKQSGREWFGQLVNWLVKCGFAQAKFDPCVFIKKEIVLAVYVDDVLMAGTDQAINAFLVVTGDQFKFKDLGKPTMLLGLDIDYSRPQISVHQRTYSLAVLRRHGMADCNGRLTPLDPNSFPPRSTDELDVARQKLYQSIVGSLNFLAIVSRPDLAYTVSLLGSYSSNPSDLHLKIAMQVLRYLQHTIDHRLTTPPQSTHQRAAIDVVMYSDASFASDPDNAKSFSGYICTVNEITVAWSSKRQSCVARSTCEAEYMAASHATSHLIWTKQALSELLSADTKINYTLMVDNEPAMSLIKDHRLNARSKHINVHYHFVRERFLDGEFDIVHVRSADNLADICTKALPRVTLERLDRLITN